jgi:hypothetical protein
VQGDHVGAGEQLVQGEQLHLHLARGGRVEERIEGRDLHLEPAGPVGHLLTDASEADDAQGLALQLDAGDLAVPSSRLRGGIGQRNAARQGEQQRESVLRGRRQVGRGRVDHQDAQLGRGGHVHVVHPDAGAAHDFQALAGAQDVGSHLGGAAHDQGIEVRQDLGQALALLLRELVDVGAGLLQELQSRGIELIGDEDAVAHDASPSRMSSISARRASRSESRTSPMWPMRKVEGFQSP